MSRPVLLTGFEPFGGRPVNASWLAVEEVSRTWTGPVPLVVERLPVSYARGPARILERIERLSPSVVIAVGEADRRSGVGLERVAVNVADARIADADGRLAIEERLDPDGPAAYLSGLALREGLAAVGRTGVPAEISPTAGGYVCNAVFYHLMAAVQGTDVAAGFVHVPLTPAHGGGDGMLTVDAALALRTVVQTELGRRATGSASVGGVP